MPIKVKSEKGFLVNRALLPYIYKAICLMLAGESADKIDQAMVRFGMPMGPIELADQVGLDVCYDVGLVLGMPEAAETALKENYLQARLAGKQVPVFMRGRINAPFVTGQAIRKRNWTGWQLSYWHQWWINAEQRWLRGSSLARMMPILVVFWALAFPDIGVAAWLGRISALSIGANY